MFCQFFKSIKEKHRLIAVGAFCLTDVQNIFLPTNVLFFRMIEAARIFQTRKDVIMLSVDYLNDPVVISG